MRVDENCYPFDLFECIKFDLFECIKIEVKLKK